MEEPAIGLSHTTTSNQKVVNKIDSSSLQTAASLLSDLLQLFSATQDRDWREPLKVSLSRQAYRREGA